MISMKKTALAAAVMLTVGTGVAQAAPVNPPEMTFSFVGSFTMYQPWQADTMPEVDEEGNLTGNFIPNPYATSVVGAVPMQNTVDPDGIPSNGDEYISTADPVTATMYMDMAGGGHAHMTPSIPFFGSWWNAHDVTLQNLGGGMVRATMLFDWSVNLNIPVTVDFSMTPTAWITSPYVDAYEFAVATVDGNGDTIPGYPMVSGPFPDYNATFAGTATYTGMTAAAPVPVPAAVWLLGSGLLGLVGVARRKKAA